MNKMNIENIKNSKTKFTGKQIYYYKEIESTQIEAKRIAQNSKVKGIQCLPSIVHHIVLQNYSLASYASFAFLIISFTNK